jgi:hypothetical protein
MIGMAGCDKCGVSGVVVLRVGDRVQSSMGAFRTALDASGHGRLELVRQYVSA